MVVEQQPRFDFEFPCNASDIVDRNGLLRSLNAAPEKNLRVRHVYDCIKSPEELQKLSLFDCLHPAA